MGPLTKIALTYRYGELWRATRHHIVSFSSVKVFPRTKYWRKVFLCSEEAFLLIHLSVQFSVPRKKPTSFSDRDYGLALRCWYCQESFMVLHRESKKGTDF